MTSPFLFLMTGKILLSSILLTVSVHAKEFNENTPLDNSIFPNLEPYSDTQDSGNKVQQNTILSSSKNTILANDDTLNTSFSDMTMTCQQTPNITASYIPLFPVARNNNLFRHTGAARHALGSYIQIRGKLVDEDCIPISNATIRLWQADSKGRMPSFITEEPSSAFFPSTGQDPHFGYSGTAQTDNLGNFVFITVFPGSFDNFAPHLNVYIDHPDFSSLRTRVYFNKHPKNKHDPLLTSLPSYERDLVLAQGQAIPSSSGPPEGRLYRIVFTLAGINKYRKY